MHCSNPTPTQGPTPGLSPRSSSLPGSSHHRKGCEDLAILERLSGLPDRGDLLNLLRRHQGSGGRAGLFLGVLVIDLQRFRSVNDALGQTLGDEVLAEVSRRIDRRRPERSFVAWLGSARFAIFYDAFLSPGEATQLAEDLLQCLGEPHYFGSRQLVLSTVIGVATTAEATSGPAQLLRDGETALFAAKRSGCPISRFTPSLRFEAVARFQMENDLRRALVQNQFVLYFQPIVQIEGEKITGVEALLRWDHPRRGILQPREFLPLVREIGLGWDVDFWVLRQACRQLAIWRRENPSLSSLTISVNFLADNLSDPRLPGLVGRSLAENGLCAADLKLECTENVPMDPNRPAAVAALQRMGVGIHIDDFGTGFSCLSHLYRVPTEALKVDRSFVEGMLYQPALLRLVEMVFDMASDLGAGVIAEGVESAEQLTLLRELGCRFAQGFLFGRPMPPECLFQHIPAPC